MGPGPSGVAPMDRKFVCLYIFVILATLLPGGADGWDLERDDTVISQHADTPDRTGLSSEMSEFLDWAFENGLDFEVRNSLHFGSTVSPCIFDSQRCIFTHFFSYSANFAESVRSREYQRGRARFGGPKGLFRWRYVASRPQSTFDNTPDGASVGNGTDVQGRKDTRLPIRNF